MKSVEVNPADLSIGLYKVGMRRDAVWKLTRSPIISFFPHEATVRSDDIQLESIFIHYNELTGLSHRIVIFTRQDTNVVLFGETVNSMNRGDILTLLKLQDVEFEMNGEKIVSRTSRIAFGFRDNDEDLLSDQKLDYIYVDSENVW